MGASGYAVGSGHDSGRDPPGGEVVREGEPRVNSQATATIAPLEKNARVERPTSLLLLDLSASIMSFCLIPVIIFSYWFQGIGIGEAPPDHSPSGMSLLAFWLLLSLLLMLSALAFLGLIYGARQLWRSMWLVALSAGLLAVAVFLVESLELNEFAERIPQRQVCIVVLIPCLLALWSCVIRWRVETSRPFTRVDSQLSGM